MKTARLALLCLFASLATAAITAPAALAEESRAQAAPFETVDLDGKRVSLADFRGRPVVVTFWATWCVPCKKAIPYFEKAVERLGQDAEGKDKLAAVAISIDDTRTQARVRGTAKRYQWKLPVLIDKDGSIASALNPRGLAPYTLFIDREGRIAHAREGFAPGDEKLLDEWLDKLAAEPAAK